MVAAVGLRLPIFCRVVGGAEPVPEGRPGYGRVRGHQRRGRGQALEIEACCRQNLLATINIFSLQADFYYLQSNYEWMLPLN